MKKCCLRNTRSTLIRQNPFDKAFAPFVCLVGKVLFSLIRDIRAIRGSVQVVHFHERNSSGVIYPTHDGGVVTRWKVCDDRRFVRIRWSVAAVLNVADLVLSDDAADDRGLPIIVAGDQSAAAIVQFLVGGTTGSSSLFRVGGGKVGRGMPRRAQRSRAAS